MEAKRRVREGTDEQLAREARDGSADAFEALVVRYEARVRGLCRRILGSEADAEDAAISAFVKAWRSLVRYDLTRPFAAWLFTIAAREAVSLARSRPAWVPWEDAPGDPSGGFAGGAGDPEAVMIGRGETRAVLRAALATASATEGEPSPRVVTAVMQQVKQLPPVRATFPERVPSTLNTLVWTLLATVILSWTGTHLWTSSLPGVTRLVGDFLAYLVNGALLWPLEVAGRTARVLVLSGFGELFPTVLAALFAAALLVFRLPGRSAR